MARWERVQCVPLGLHRFILGSGLEKDLICVAGPPCKCRLGENPQRLFGWVCFHWRWSKGAYCGKLGRRGDVTDKSEPVNKVEAGAVGSV